MKKRYIIKHGTALLGTSWRPKTVILKSIWVAPEARGRGTGTNILEKVCEDLDYHGLRCLLRVCPTGQMGVKALVAWYESFGFRGTEKRMVREPQG